MWWVHSYYQSGNGDVVIFWIFWVVFSIVMHELSHGWAALWQGDRTPIQLERMTMNPMVHMGGLSLIMLVIVGIAWGVMPVDPSRFRSGRRGRMYVAVAGPAMNVLLAIVAVIGLAAVSRYVDPDSKAFYYGVRFFYYGAELNIVLAIFNLLPVPPLDGSGIIAGTSLKGYQLMHHPNAQTFGMFLVLALLISGGFGVLWSLGHKVVQAVAVPLAGTEWTQFVNV